VRKQIVLVLGIARSGTSALAGSLSYLGVDFGKGLKEADWQNPKGNYEHLQISLANQRILSALDSSWSDHRLLPASWCDRPEVQEEAAIIASILSDDFKENPVIGLKDPRLVPLFDIYVRIIGDLGYDLNVVSVRRKPEEVIESIGNSGYYQSAYSESLGLRLYHHYMGQIESIHKGYGGLQVDYEALIGRPLHTVETIRSAFPAPLSSQLVRAEESGLLEFIDEELYRCRLPTR
jgi:hypothetical protein